MFAAGREPVIPAGASAGTGRCPVSEPGVIPRARLPEGTR